LGQKENFKRRGYRMFVWFIPTSGRVSTTWDHPLVAVYDWFTEGFAKDFKEAKSLIYELSS
jgi:hypothetical protein